LRELGNFFFKITFSNSERDLLTKMLLQRQTLNKVQLNKNIQVQKMCFEKNLKIHVILDKN
jgi:hypothetical protein